MLNLYKKIDYKMGLIRRFKWWYRREKFKWQRALWGFSAYDTWDMNTYLAELIGDMLLYKAKFDMSYFNDMTEQEKQQWLIDTAQMFKDYNRDFPVPSYNKYRDSVIRTKNADGSITVEGDPDLAKAWIEEEKNIYNYKMSRLKEGFDRLCSRYSELWD